jgi:hypothetical protein
VVGSLVVQKGAGNNLRRNQWWFEEKKLGLLVILLVGAMLKADTHDVPVAA